MSEASSQNDEFVEKLRKNKEELQACQSEKGLESCMNCKQLIGCELRNTYVRSVYESMSKGETGGFDF